MCFRPAQFGFGVHLHSAAVVEAARRNVQARSAIPDQQAFDMLSYGFAMERDNAVREAALNTMLGEGRILNLSAKDRTLLAGAIINTCAVTRNPVTNPMEELLKAFAPSVFVDSFEESPLAVAMNKVFPTAARRPELSGPGNRNALPSS